LPVRKEFQENPPKRKKKLLTNRILLPLFYPKKDVHLQNMKNTISVIPLRERINAFAALGERLQIAAKTDADKTWNRIIEEEHIHNPWFIAPFVRQALTQIADMLDKEKLEKWIEPYRETIEQQTSVQRIGTVMAGNIPLVGFHDFLCVLLSGNIFAGKLSASDARLLPAVARTLSQIEPRMSTMIEFEEKRLKNFDKVIATGSDAAIAALKPYFEPRPALTRKHCNSIAVLDGTETEKQLSALSDDMFLYFGIGCRSVSQIYLPLTYNFQPLFDAIDKQYKEILYQHHKYMNNLEYQKTVHLFNRIPFLDQGVCVFEENTNLHSPISVVHYQYYEDLQTVIEQITQYGDKMQCAVSDATSDPNIFFPLGKAQNPPVNEFANQINTLKFILQNENTNH
jgi:hypothetical protein